MPNYALQNVSDDILSALNDLAVSRSRSDLDIARVRRQALPLKSIDPCAYYVIEGICSSLQRRPEDVAEWFECAIRAGGWNAAVAGNYAIALHEAGDFSGAWDVIDRGLATFKSNRAYLEYAYNAFRTTGNLERAAYVQRLLESHSPQSGGFPWEDYLSALSEAGVDTQKLGELIRAAHGVVVEHAGGRPTMFYNVTWDAGQPHLSVGIVVNGTAETMHKIELAVWGRVNDLIDSLEADRAAGEGSMLDWITFYIRGHQHATQLHAA